MTTRAHIKQDRARSLHLGGLTYQQVADADDPTTPGKALYASAGAARNAVLASMLRHGGDTAVDKVPLAERRGTQHDRYERLITVMMSKALGGDDKAQARVMVAMRQQAELFGLITRPSPPPHVDAPEEDVVDDLQRRRELRRAATARGAAPATSEPTQ